MKAIMTLHFYLQLDSKCTFQIKCLSYSALVNILNQCAYTYFFFYGAYEGFGYTTILWRGMFFLSITAVYLVERCHRIWRRVSLWHQETHIYKHVQIALVARGFLEDGYFCIYYFIFEVFLFYFCYFLFCYSVSTYCFPKSIQTLF